MTQAVNYNAICGQLINLRDQAGDAHYRRVVLADQLLKSRQWVEAADGGGGNESVAIDRISDTYLADIVGLVSLPEMLDILHNFPDVKLWRQHKFSFVAMAQQLRDQKKGKAGTKKIEHKDFGVRRNDLTPPLSFPDMTPAQAKAEYTRAFDKAQSWKERFDREHLAHEATKKELVVVTAENRELKRKLDLIQVAFGHGKSRTA